MSLETRIQALELSIAPSADPWDVGALAVQRRREAAALDAWEERVRAHARCIGEDPERYLCRTRRRLIEERGGPPVGKHTLVNGRIRIIPIEPGDEDDPRIVFVYSRDREGQST